MIGGSLAVLAVAAALVLNAMRDSIVFFSTPAAVAERQIPAGKRFRLGGLVKPGSLVRGDDLSVRFLVTDDSAALPVSYKGILPDLFREGQGVVAEGALDPSGVFKADTVLAKHDENYMPKEVADALKQQGHWKDDYAKKPNYNAKSEVTCSVTSAANEAPTNSSWASAVERATFIRAGSRQRAPMTGTVDWISASASASTSA